MRIKGEGVKIFAEIWKRLAKNNQMDRRKVQGLLKIFNWNIVRKKIFFNDFEITKVIQKILHKNDCIDVF